MTEKTKHENTARRALYRGLAAGLMPDQETAGGCEGCAGACQCQESEQADKVKEV